MSRGWRRSLRGPATRVRTGSRSSWTGIGLLSCGTSSCPLSKGGRLPVGLGARDTLRLEAGMPLYGNELDTSTNPFEAGLGRVVKLTKPGDFVGRAAFERAASAAPTRTLVGLVVEGRGIARHGYPVYAGERRTGAVTSGTHSPTIGSPIAMGVRRSRRCRAGYDSRGRNPRSTGPGPGRPTAVLQATRLT